MNNFYINKNILMDENEMVELKMMPEDNYNKLSEEEKREWVLYNSDMDLNSFVSVKNRHSL